MKLYEIYTSIQGETHYAGLPCTLVRFAACDLRCTYCDTEYAFTGGRDVSRASIVADVVARSVKLVLLTGGEPLLQPELPQLASELLERGYEVMVETGGHRDVTKMPTGTVLIVDIKTPGSGESLKNRWANLEHLGPNDAVKFVCTSEDDYVWAREVIREHALEARCNVLLSPGFGQVEPRMLTEWMLRDNLRVRLNLQIHKYVWPPELRGV